MAHRLVNAKRSATHRAPTDEHAATELVMYIENTSDLSPDGPSGQGRSVLLNALRKWKKGTYDPALAVRLFEYLVESGAKQYAKEFGSSEREWSTMFNPATRHEAAKQLEASFRNSAENGEYDHVDTRIGHHSSESRVAESARSLYDELVAAGQQIDHHESDLYVKWTPEAVRIIQAHGAQMSTFKNQIDGALWIDVPFAYTPWWEKRTRAGEAVAESPPGESFTPQLSGQYVGRRVEIVRVAGQRPSSYFKAGQFGYVVGQNSVGGMAFMDADRDSKPGEIALLIAKTRNMRGGALWFSLEGVRFTNKGRESNEPVGQLYAKTNRRPRRR